MTFRIPTVLILSSTLAICGLSATLAHAGQTGPAAFLKSQDKKLKPLLADTDKNKTKILTAINAMMDFEALSKASLGKHWNARSAEEQKEFSDTLKALIEKNLVKRLKDSKDHVISYGTEQISGDQASVTTLVKAGTDPRADEIEVVYKMHKKKGNWIVVDMVTDEVSLVSNYQSQFNKIITEDGWPVLMKKMKDKLAEQ